MTTPHSRWSHYDETLEMAALDAMHAKLLAGDLDVSAEAARLRGLAKACGYGEADSFLTDHAGEDPANPAEAAIRADYDGYMDGDYWNCIDGSGNVFLDALERGPAMKAGRAALQGMRDGFEEGRAAREAEEARPSAPVREAARPDAPR